jgi:hypothetical protein
MAQWAWTKILIRGLRCMISGRERTDGRRQKQTAEALGRKNHFPFAICHLSFSIDDLA